MRWVIGDMLLVREWTLWLMLWNPLSQTFTSMMGCGAFYHDDESVY